MKTRRLSTKIDIQQLLNSEYIKHMNKKAYIRHILKDNNKPISWKILQKGGTQRRINQDGYVFLYDENDDDGFILCVSKRTPKGICFNIDFNEEEGIYINISHYRGCSENKDLPEEGGTLIMLKAILRIILSKPTINNYNNIFLTDNSTIMCKKEDKKYNVKLMDMYFLCTGCMWYSSLAPMFMRSRIDSQYFLNDREKIVGTEAVSWIEFLEKLKPSIVDELNGIGHIYYLIDNKNIDINKKGSASKLLNEMRLHTEIVSVNGKEEKQHPYCELFYKHMRDFFKAFGVTNTSYSGTDWGILIRNGRILICDEYELHQSCMGRRGWLIPRILLENVTLNEYNELLGMVQK